MIRVVEKNLNLEVHKESSEIENQDDSDLDKADIVGLYDDED